MKAWEKALRKFLKDWEKEDYVLAAMATGSYVAGTATKFSDIDVHIILSDKTKWRERGNKIVDGYLIEYFANPARQLKKYLAEDYKDNTRVDATMFMTGKVIFDKTGVMDKLTKQAKVYFFKKFNKPDKTWIELQKYGLWDKIDGLRDLSHKKSPSFKLVYYNTLHAMLKTYTKYKRADTAAPSKIDRYFTEPSFRTAYRMDEFPDKKFASLFMNCLLTKNEKTMLKDIESLYTHIINKMGGFKIDGWKVRSKI